jgi:hypothetical protein
MENPSRKWEWSHLSGREAGRVVAVCLLLLLFCITGCDNTGGGGGGGVAPEQKKNEPPNLAAFKQVLQDAAAGISADGELVHVTLNWQLYWRAFAVAANKNMWYIWGNHIKEEIAL